MAKKAASSVSPLDPSMRIVVLHGEERFLIEEYTRQLAGLLKEKFGGVEEFSFDGETADPANVLDELRSYGLMQRHKLVILDHADDFLAGGGKNAAASDDDDDDDEHGKSEKKTRRPLMERYAESPVPDATLLMRARTWRPGKLDKLIAKVGTINACETPSPSKAADWCIKRASKRYQTSIEPAAALHLVERIGPDLLHLDTELSKLTAMAGEGKPITRDLVAQAVGLSREEKAWEIQTAIVSGDASEMLRKLRELLEISQHDVVPITWAICDLLRKVHTASHLLKRRVPPQAVFGQAKLWGAAGHGMLHIAGEHGPEVFAQLLRRAIQVDLNNKSGIGDPQRSIEALLVSIADTISSATV